MDGKEFNKLTKEYTEKYLNNIKTFKNHLNHLENSCLETFNNHLDDLEKDPESVKNRAKPMPQWQKLALISAANYDNLNENEQIKLLALTGETESEGLLGASYLSEDYVEKKIDYQKAFLWSSRAAQKNSPGAIYCLGMIYYYGYGLPKNHKIALDLFNRSIDLGLDNEFDNKDWSYYDARTFIGNIYRDEENYKLAFDYYSAAAIKGDAVSQYNLGVCYDLGKGVNTDNEEALKWYLKSAERGNSKAQSILGYMCSTGKGLPQDYKAALKWYSKAVEQGNLNAINYFGFANEHGHGFPQDYKMAYKWYKSAAEQGFAESQTNLGKLYLKGYGVLQNYVKAVRWFTKAAEDEDSEAQLVLGIMHIKGEYFDPNNQKGAYWINLARKNGNKQAEELWNEDELWKYE